MTQIYNIVSIIAFSLSALFFLLSLFFWFKFNIWDIIGDLSGHNAKKSIRQMREENEKTNISLYRPSGSYGTENEKREISVRHNEQADSAATTILSENHDGDETTILNGTAEELSDSGATELLSESIATQDEEGTTILRDSTVDEERQSNSQKMIILQSIVLVHTDEEIA